METTFEASMPGTPLGVRMVRREMTAMAAGCGMDADGVADVRLAVTEAATNAVMHAYAETEGELTVSAVARDGELAIVICDAGAGFVEGREEPGPGSRALHHRDRRRAQRRLQPPRHGDPHGVPVPERRIAPRRRTCVCPQVPFG